MPSGDAKKEESVIRLFVFGLGGLRPAIGSFDLQYCRWSGMSHNQKHERDLRLPRVTSQTANLIFGPRSA